ncbi:RDD family protein [Kitasatospora sp. NPDC127111]|uniref:RDD family protein n=1 Tax=Kitasatospora sp. NPDC127111 TaxID=3345363 RepID=UPI00363BE12C
MAQGYPPGSYGQQQYAQNPYGQNPYGGQPYPPQQPYPGQPPYQQAPQPYPPQQAPQHQQPYPPQQQYQQAPPYQGQQPHQGQPYGHAPQQPNGARVPRPEEASGFRRYPAILVDWLLAVVLGFVAAKAAGGSKVDHAGAYFGTLLVAGFGASFVNQVVLGRLLGFSVGKGLMALRVIRKKDGSRPNTRRLTKRWALGFVIIAISLITEDYEDEEFMGVRVVRWKHLREYQQATGRLG